MRHDICNILFTYNELSDIEKTNIYFVSVSNLTESIFAIKKLPIITQLNLCCFLITKEKKTSVYKRTWFQIFIFCCSVCFPADLYLRKHLLMFRINKIITGYLSKTKQLEFNKFIPIRQSKTYSVQCLMLTVVLYPKRKILTWM